MDGWLKRNTHTHGQQQDDQGLGTQEQGGQIELMSGDVAVRLRYT